MTLPCIAALTFWRCVLPAVTAAQRHVLLHLTAPAVAAASAPALLTAARSLAAAVEPKVIKLWVLLLLNLLLLLVLNGALVILVGDEPWYPESDELCDCILLSESERLDSEPAAVLIFLITDWTLKIVGQRSRALRLLIFASEALFSWKLARDSAGCYSAAGVSVIPSAICTDNKSPSWWDIELYDPSVITGWFMEANQSLVIFLEIYWSNDFVWPITGQNE